jgi:uncharacterized membrane protein YfcA
MPVYVAVERAQVAAIWSLVAIASVGVVVGTLAGQRVLVIVPEQRFKQIVGAIILLLGIAMLVRRSV